MKVVQAKIRFVDYYTLLNLDSLMVGSAAPFDIFIKKSNNYIIIIEAGTILSKSIYAKLKKQEKLYIFEKDKEKLTLTCDSLKFYINYNKNNPEKRIEFIYKLNNELFNNYLAKKDNKFDLKCVTLIVKSILFLIKYDENFLINTMPHFTHEHTLPNHSFHVATYAINLGNLLNLNSKKLLQLGTAALLHDVGLKKIDNSLITKSTKLNIAELEEVHKHTQYSVKIIKQNNIYDPYIIDAIMHHHEQYDAKGYPDQLDKKDISVFASILSICDVFDALTSSRPYREQYTSFDAIKLMLKDSSMSGKFNRKYLKLLLKSL